MNKKLYQFFEKDHRRLDDLLDRATRHSEIDMDLYHQFRVGLLTHIKMEEKVLFPAAKEANQGKELPEMEQLRLDHGALTALMAVPPDHTLIRVLSKLLQIHDDAEERPGGIYDLCEKLTRHRTDELIEILEETTDVPVRPLKPSDYVLQATKRALERAGYDYDELAK